MNGYLRFVEDLLPCTVTIHSQVPESSPASRLLGTERMGSGSIVHADGYIVTAGYIVLGANKISVTFPDKRVLDGEIADHDYDSGISVIKVEGGKLPAMPIGDSDTLGLGQSTLVLASLGGVQRKVNTGVITDLDGFDAYWEYMLDKAIRTTAVNPGLGGGALVDYSGRLIGVVSLNLNEIRGTTLAIPINLHSAIQNEILAHGMNRPKRLRPWLGTFIQPHEEGVEVFGLVPGGPAERAGLEAGDVVVELDNEEIPSRVAYYEALWRHDPGQSFELLILRDKEMRRFTVNPSSRKEYFG